MFEDIEQLFDEINAKSAAKYEPSNIKTIDSFDNTDDTDDTDEQVNLGNYRVRTCARTRGLSENIRIICIICYVPVVNTGCQLPHGTHLL